MKKIIAFIIGIISMIITGIALSFGWNTFVLKIIDLPKISIWTAVALVQMYELIVYKYKDTSNITDDQWINMACDGLATSLLTLGLLFILSLI